MRRWASLVLASALVVAGCSRPAASSTPTERPSAEGIAACPTPEASGPVEGGLPDLELPCLTAGGPTKLSGLRGPMVINFWAQWCGPCREEAPHLLQAHQALGAKVTFLGVDVQDPQPDRAVAFAQEAGWPWAQLMDPDQKLRESSLQVTGLPVTLLVDAQGRVVARHAGPFASAEQLQKLVHDKLGVR